MPPAIDAVFLLAIDGFLTGRWDETERLVAEGLDWSEKTGIALLRSPGHWLRALIAAGRGQYDRVEDLTTSLRRWAAPRGAMAFARYAAHADALAAAGRGDFEMAFVYASSISRAGELRPHVPHALWVVLDLVEAAVRTGRPADARAHVRAAQEAGIAAISSRMNLLVTAAAAVAGLGDPLASFRAALKADEVDTWCFDTARVRLLHGQELHKRGRIAEARAELLVARQAFSDLDASPWFARASDELRNRPGSRVSPHAGSRTKRSAESSTSRRGPCPRICTRSSPSSTSRAGPASETPSQHPPALVKTTAGPRGKPQGPQGPHRRRAPLTREG